ncbi:inorganic phosphate transporter [Methanoplanus endosymbiosus]|uniref:Phosphate transporter n=1 Tax=Methanoplanus endosymbiosus TaxID=33865 RepID=A0A9E7TJP3_9EURY|nr:inorganic phosphate transporter [Methanoplanus endosymbiosus]UUX91935.1 inorganic phosphate transporter [Methanoplanus endosymbiosus]
MEFLIIVAGIILAYLFNFVNGLNDAANSIATIVATKALSPLKAVLMASFFNLIGPLVFTTAIAAMIGKGIVDPSFMTSQLLLGAMFGAVIWVFSASYFGIPVSSSHALIGGLLGAGIASGGLGAIVWPTAGTAETLLFFMLAGGTLFTLLFLAVCIYKNENWRLYLIPAFLAGISFTVPLLIIFDIVEVRGILAVVVFIIVSPMLGLISALLLGLIIMRLFQKSNPSKLNHAFKPLQIIAGAFQAVGHGANDAQNAMGMITAMLLAGGFLTEFEVPFWVIISSCLMISLGTLLGGWRVVEKMANRITKIRPYQGFAASAAGGTVLSLMTSFGVPVSTTHAMSGAIMGAGASRGYSSAVKWGIVREIVAAWILTIPAAAFVSGMVYLIIATYL